VFNNNASEIQKLQADLAEQVKYVKGLSTAMEKSMGENDDLKVELKEALDAAKKKKKVKGRKPVFKGTPATTANTPGEYWPPQGLRSPAR
jgi:regulator of replication initiation timing